ncbi:tripartite tricarboxylate transporter TctB family protein [Magnetospira sp. QH-2]|uniref:tripartite tricarboxylate transporter TctB family protein n=1 Tax=Magnetospira sp. (strain QH-2) TaxID=1288970 RepID=UPI0003E81A31|nr:tripartite tricarboxylate transporter TctB family protein [Magnetospira sp. QH-2]CCQ75123.1 conserved membrane protein of unknown function [Magnetospira sp. QH-2]
MTMPMKNIVAAIIFAMLGIGYGLLASSLPDRSGIAVPGPAFFPYLIAGFIVLLAVALFYKGLTDHRKTQDLAPGARIPWRGVGLIGWFALFIAALPYLGFLFAGIPFFAGLMFMCDTRRWLSILLWSVAVPLVLFYLFRVGFSILLPHAQWM